MREHPFNELMVLRFLEKICCTQIIFTESNPIAWNRQGGQVLMKILQEIEEEKNKKMKGKISDLSRDYDSMKIISIIAT